MKRTTHDDHSTDSIGVPTRQEVVERGSVTGQQFTQGYEPPKDPFLRYLRGAGVVSTQAAGRDALEEIEECATAFIEATHEADRAETVLAEVRSRSKAEATEASVSAFLDEVGGRWSEPSADEVADDEAADSPDAPGAGATDVLPIGPPAEGVTESVPEGSGGRIPPLEVVPSRRGYPFIRRLSDELYLTFLLVIMAGEGILNYKSFEKALGEDPALTLVASITTGALLGMACHLAGAAIAELEAVGRRRGRSSLVALLVVGSGIAAGLAGVTYLRASGGGMAPLAVLLLQLLFVGAAVVAAWRHAAPDLEERERLEGIRDGEHALVADAEELWVEATKERDAALVRLRRVIEDAVLWGESVVSHAGNLVALYLDGVQHGAGRQFDLDDRWFEVHEPDWLIDARQWLQIVGTWPEASGAAVDQELADLVPGLRELLGDRRSIAWPDDPSASLVDADGADRDGAGMDQADRDEEAA